MNSGLFGFQAGHTLQLDMTDADLNTIGGAQVPGQLLGEEDERCWPPVHPNDTMRFLKPRLW